MVVREIKGEDYIIYYNPDTQTVSFQGELSLGGPPEYAPINQLLDDVVTQQPPAITLDVTKLEFLNSSGINMISKFIIRLRKKTPMQVLVVGSTDIAWQGKSLKNLKKLLPSLQLELV
jgi:hypothetical protein